MKRTTILVVILILLLSGLSFNTIGQEYHKGNIITVDDDGGADYIRIQDAIDNASDGDTVYVYEGNYFENVYVNKPISLVGENRNSTLIMGSDDINVVYISVDNVTFHGFTINNSHIQNQIGGGAVRISSSHNNIFDINVIDNHWIGIHVSGSSNMINSNKISNNFHDGIYIGSGNSNKIISNTISNNKIGIYNSGFCHDTEILGNTISMNDQDGINFIVSKGHLIGQNHIYDNFFSGISLREIYGSTIFDNYCYDNNRGINIASSISNTFRGNIITNTSREGIYLWASHFNLISDNTITDSERGFILSLSRFNMIRRNNIMDNREDPQYDNSFGCRWIGNYWGEDCGNIKIIHGIFIIAWFIWFPVIQIDWNPAKEPYDIPIGGNI